MFESATSEDSRMLGRPSFQPSQYKTATHPESSQSAKGTRALDVGSAKGKGKRTRLKGHHHPSPPSRTPSRKPSQQVGSVLSSCFVKGSVASPSLHAPSVPLSPLLPPHFAICVYRIHLSTYRHILSQDAIYMFCAQYCTYMKIYMKLPHNEQSRCHLQ